MADVFLDSVGPYHLSIVTSADWTVSSGGMPNGDNYVTGDGSIASTFNMDGDAFHIGDGTAWTVECWLYYTTARATAEQIMSCAAPNASSNANEAWWLELDSAENATFTLVNTAPGIYLTVSSGVLSTSTWHHIVVLKETGDVLKMYVDNSLVATDNTPSGTVKAPTSTYRLHFGTRGDGTLDINSPSTGLRVSKLAIYNLELSAGDINTHYLAMTT